MPFDPNAIAASPFVALVEALVFLGLVIAGILVRGKLVEDLLKRVDRMADAFEERNRIDEERLRWNKEHDDRRNGPRAAGG